MTEDDAARRWAETFGLAQAPLFEVSEARTPSRHHVLLDGGHGSFALSEDSEEEWRREDSADWAWSSNLPHHVAITAQKVTVTRWDRAIPEVLSRRSVEAQLDAFYAYLVADRVRSTRRVVEHSVDIFRRVRSLVVNAGADDAASVDAFLAVLDLAGERSVEADRRGAGSPAILAADARSAALAPLPGDGVSALVAAALAGEGGPGRCLLPNLAVRHAGSEIFQDAHFELVRAPGQDLFALPGAAEVKTATRGGAHFTPPALARSLAEQTLAQIADLGSRPSLSISDLACGSGAFLHEAIRTLRRSGFQGQLTVIGRDVSQPAVAMARYVVAHALRDWTPPGGAHTDIRVSDSLVGEPPKADVVLMNPPFIAWAAMDDEQRERVREVLSHRMGGRADYSMAFVTRALGSLNPGGALGTLLPASLLSLQAAADWREDIATNWSVRFLASLGDYGLFAHALVQIAALVVGAGKGNARMATGLVAADDPSATGDALRGLRRTKSTSGPLSVTEDRWRVFSFQASSLAGRSNWRFVPPRAEAALKRVWDSGAKRLAEVFDVKQGVRTGRNPVFVLGADQLRSLPPKERVHFRPAVMNESLEGGRLRDTHWVFYPHRPEGAVFASEEALLDAVPTYAKRFLLPQRTALSKRANITRGGRTDWWGLSEPRNTWALRGKPRLASKYFGGIGGFAADQAGAFVVVQGFGWLPKWIKAREAEEGEDEGPTASNQDGVLLSAYVALFNSALFGRLLELHSAYVAGGQYDLSPRYVDHMPVPLLADLIADERLGAAVVSLGRMGEAPDPLNRSWASEVSRLASALYGGLEVGDL
jgi:SAM-dependent methyltransferase